LGEESSELLEVVESESSEDDFFLVALVSVLAAAGAGLVRDLARIEVGLETAGLVSAGFFLSSELELDVSESESSELDSFFFAAGGILAAGIGLETAGLISAGFVGTGAGGVLGFLVRGSEELESESESELSLFLVILGATGLASGFATVPLTFIGASVLIVTSTEVFTGALLAGV